MTTNSTGPDSLQRMTVENIRTRIKGMRTMFKKKIVVDINFMLWKFVLASTNNLSVVFRLNAINKN